MQFRSKQILAYIPAGLSTALINTISASWAPTAWSKGLLKPWERH